MSILIMRTTWSQVAVEARGLFTKLIPFVIALYVASCSTTPPPAVKHSASGPSDRAVNASLMNGSFWMSAPGVSCSGRYRAWNKTKIEMPVACTDGRLGTVTLSKESNSSEGRGSYRLSDGSMGSVAFSHLSSPSAKLLSENDTDTQTKKQPDKAVSLKSISNVSATDVIAASRANYPGNCPCPYDRDAAGRNCGKRSAYSRAGGYSVKCYPRDVSAADLATFGR